ncbi:YncE family protein [Pseudomonas frederiksbergensis]|uniref:YncE family protein n=1 Tax=Pseudomonas frederiksbergensis TaxID=104087 RepID=UPI003D05B83B
MPTPNESPLLLKELDIPGRTGPVSTAPDVWGINIAAALDNFPRQGLQCRAGPWGVMGVGDVLRIFWGTGNQVLQDTIDPEEVNKELTLFVPSRHLTEGAFDVSYTVQRLGQSPEPSEVTKVLVKLTRPGGHDDNDQPGHSKLVMKLPQPIIDGGIDQDNVGAGVLMLCERYPNIAAGDVIQVTWGGVFVLSPPLTQDQADGRVAITLLIDEATIRKAGDSDASGLAVAFEVYDRVDNRSEDWSPEQRVVVNLDVTLLQAPLLKESRGNVLDLDELGNNNGTAQVWAVDDTKFKNGDTLFVRVRGTPQEGAPIDIELPGEVLSGLPIVWEVTIENALLRRLAKSQMVLSYRLQKADGSPELRSKGRFISVIGELQLLKAPIAMDAQQGAIDPDLTSTQIKILYDESFNAGDAIKLFWLGTRPDFTTYLPDLPLHSISRGEAEAKEPLFIDVDGQHLREINGGTLELYYQLLSDDAVVATMNRVNATHAIRESEHSPLLNVGEPRLELPEPTVAGVVDGALPPDRPGTTLTVNYLLTLQGDRVTREWVGSKTGKDTDWVDLSSFTAGKPVPFTIKAELIKGNEGGMVSASYFIERANERTKYANALVFSVGVALELKAPQIKQAPGTTLNPVAAKDALTAVVDYDDMQVGDKITVTWAAAAGRPDEGSHTTTSIDIVTVSPKDVPLPNSLVAFCLGTTVSVTYSVTRGSDPAQPSRPLLLNVLNIPDQSADLPTPTIAGVTETDLNVAALKGDEKLAVNEWLLQLGGQRVWLSFKGVKENGAEDELVIWEGPPHNPSAGLETTAPVDWLKTLKEGSELTVTFMVNFDKVADRATAVRFPVRIYTVKTLIATKLIFINAPYYTTPSGRVKVILLGLYSANDIPIPNTNISLTLPAGFTYADGGTGERVFKSGNNGVVIVRGTQGGNSLGTFQIVATHAELRAVVNISIQAQRPLGAIDVRAVEILISPDGSRLYCRATGVDTIVVADTTTLLEVARFRMPVRDNSRILAISPDGERLYLTCHLSDDYPVAADTISNTVAGKLTVRSSAGIVISPDSSRIYVGCDPHIEDYQVAVFDAVTLQRSSYISVAGHPNQIVISPDGNWLYASVSNNGNIYLIDTRTSTAPKHIPTSENNFKLAMSPDGAFVYASHRTRNSVAVISTDSNQLVKDIPVSYVPDNIVFSPDGAYAYVSHRQAHLITVIDAMTQQVVQQIESSSYVYGIAVSPDSSRVYICRTLDNTIEVIQGL